jgi:hypothetical protein
MTLGLGSFVRAHDLGVVDPDGALVTHEGAGVSCEPDLTFVSWAAFDEKRVVLRQRQATTWSICRGLVGLDREDHGILRGDSSAPRSGRHSQ